MQNLKARLHLKPKESRRAPRKNLQLFPRKGRRSTVFRSTRLASFLPRSSTLVFLALAVLAGNLIADKKAPPSVKKPVNLVWPLPPQKPRIKFLDYLANNTDVEPPKQKGWLQKLINEDAS